MGAYTRELPDPGASWRQIPGTGPALDEDEEGGGVCEGEGEESEDGETGEGEATAGGTWARHTRVGGAKAGKRKKTALARPPSYLSLFGTNICEAFNRLVNELVRSISHLGCEKAEMKMLYLVTIFNLGQLRRLYPDGPYGDGRWTPDWAMFLPEGLLGGLAPTEELFGEPYYQHQMQREAIAPGCLELEFKARMEAWRAERLEMPGEMQDQCVYCDDCSKCRRLPVAKQGLAWERYFTCDKLENGTCEEPEEEWPDTQVISTPKHHA